MAGALTPPASGREHPRALEGPTLAIHPGALGDVLLSVPALRALRASAHGALVLAAQPRIGALLTALAVVDRALAFDAIGLDRLFVDEPAPDTREAPPSAIVGASRVVCWFGARDAAFVRRLRQLAPSAVVASPTSDGPSVWEHLVTTVETIVGAETACDPLRETIAVPGAVRDEGRRALLEAGWDDTPFLLVHPGAGGLTKRWPAPAFARVVETIAGERRVAVVVHEGPADGEAVAALDAHLRGRLGAPLLRLDHPGLSTLAGVMAHASAYLGNDSGVSHLSSAVGVPSLILFTPQNLAWRPWSPVTRTLVVDVATVDSVQEAAVTTALRELVTASGASRAPSSGSGTAGAPAPGTGRR